MNNTSALPISDTVICDTSHFSIIKVSGEDAPAFLQGQFSNDVALLNPLDSQLNSYNSPKGRMYASFRLCNLDSNYYLLLPTEITPPVFKRLKMFIMRSKVIIEDITEQWTTLGVSGVATKDALATIHITLPENINACVKHEDSFAINISDKAENIIPRTLLIGPNENIASIKNTLQETFPTANSEHWKRLDIHAGIPNIYTNTMESFVAQMVNFQLIDGVSFTKGCYPGQEVVARMHYLGKLKKRMYRISLKEKASPDDKIVNANSDNPQSAGQIVDAQKNETGGYDALAVIQVAAAESGKLKLNSLDGEDISLETLPYAFPAEKD